MAAAGRLELSESPGENGLHPVIATSTGMSSSARRTVANGKRFSNVASWNRGRPQQPPGYVPSGAGKKGRSFQTGTGPSRTRATFGLPLIQIAANSFGSLSKSGWLRKENLVRLPV